MFCLLHNIQHLDDFVTYLLSLCLEKIFKIMLICYNFSDFHGTKVIYKLRVCKFLDEIFV